MSDLTLQRADSHTYDVYFVVPGSPRFVWRIATHGITLSDSGIAYTVNDSPRTAAFTEIAAIHLSTAALGNASSVIDQCKIEFNNGAFRPERSERREQYRRPTPSGSQAGSRLCRKEFFEQRSAEPGGVFYRKAESGLGGWQFQVASRSQRGAAT
jgi:hypothetical protein